MKSFVVGAFFCFAWASLGFAGPKSCKAIDELVGPVREVAVFVVLSPEVDGTAGRSEKYVRTYDRDGSCIGQSDNLFVDDHTGRPVLEFDDHGRVRSGTGLGSDKSWGFKRVGTCEPEQTLCEFRVLDADGSLVGTWTNEYDRYGNAVERKMFAADGSLKGRILSEVDTSGRIVGTRTFRNGELITLQSFSYDGSGRMIESNSHDPKTSLSIQIRNEYKLDRFGNWIKKTSSLVVDSPDGRDIENTSILTRVISYY